jgi:hypothetical protein
MDAQAYDSPLTQIDRVDSRYFQIDGTTMRFVGKSLEARVPTRYGVYNLLTLSDQVEAIGVMDLIFDGKEQASLHMLAKFKSTPSDIGRFTYRGAEYTTLHLTHGDIFMGSTDLVKDKNIVAAIWSEFVMTGYIPYWFGYEDLFSILDQDGYMCDSAIPVNHALLEVVYAHLTRLKSNKFISYRTTDMKEPSEFISLRDVKYSPDSTLDKIMGSYSAQGLAAALVHPNEQRKTFEDILRGIPPMVLSQGVQ